MPSVLNATTTNGIAVTGDNSGSLQLATNNGTTALTIDTSQNVGIGTSSPTRLLSVGTLGTTTTPTISIGGSTTSTQTIEFGRGTSGAQQFDGYIQYTQSNNAMAFGTNGATERMRITSAGDLLIGKTAADDSTQGFRYSVTSSSYYLSLVRNGEPLYINRITTDGTLVGFAQDSTVEGNISVSGTTVSYNGGHLSRWSQLPDNSKDDTILKGTVLTNLDDMCVWIKDGEVLPNEQLNKMKVSDVEGDANVAGVFVNWTFDEQCQSDDMNVAMTGDMIIRIAEGVVVQKGDLLMSAGDGTAKPQGDDIRKSKTIAKVTSNHVTCTYADGSYCVPCVLMAC
jgi:hypothetical protein